jgi:hypothetical protein
MTSDSTKKGCPQNMGAFGFSATATCSLDQALAMTAYTARKKNSTSVLEQARKLRQKICVHTH